ncbi:MAG: glucoamylase family protein, partial [Bacteroidota bacterium]|nr:glucoamylase family protein [Bacteroidota bacterium]
SSNLTSRKGYSFNGFANYFYTALDSSYKFPPLTDDALLTLIQQQTFKYFYDFAHPDCGMARERNTSGDIVATGGSGFGVMALIVGIERGFITRPEGLARLDKILTFLETSDRFHGAWPHWFNGSTGKVYPFSTEDDGADMVETSYMAEGLLTMRQYLDSSNPSEKTLIDRINALYDAIEFDWFTQGGQNVLYWNWSPDYGWAINLKIQGYNETLITYLMAASSPTHSISKEVYTEGYARNGYIRNGGTFYGYYLPLGENYGGPLFFTHYTYLGLDPRNLSDQYANYWQQNVNQSLINYTYCKTNPKGWMGYSSSSWGLTASDNPWGYSAHSPTNDLGVITPTAAVSALPYAPQQSMAAIRHFYYILGNRLWGPYGFYDAFDVTAGWWASSYIAIDEGPIICMIENYRSQLLWNLFMSCPEVRQGLTKLGFSYK